MSAPRRRLEAVLTPRELEVCELVGEGLTTHAIAERLGISPRTVEAHIYNAARHIPGGAHPMKRIIRAFNSEAGSDGS